MGALTLFSFRVVKRDPRSDTVSKTSMLARGQQRERIAAHWCATAWQ
jgi:hypothetical protein